MKIESRIELVRIDTIDAIDYLRETASDLAAEGWELVSVIPIANPARLMLFFRRDPRRDKLAKMIDRIAPILERQFPGASDGAGSIFSAS